MIRGDENTRKLENKSEKLTNIFFMLLILLIKKYPIIRPRGGIRNRAR